MFNYKTTTLETVKVPQLDTVFVTDSTKFSSKQDYKNEWSLRNSLFLYHAVIASWWMPRKKYQDWLVALKVASATFFLFCFFNIKEHTCETWKKCFLSLPKLFLFWRKSNFRILDIQISSYHQTPKHKIRNRFCWIAWEVNIVC